MEINNSIKKAQSTEDANIKHEKILDLYTTVDAYELSGEIPQEKSYIEILMNKIRAAVDNDKGIFARFDVKKGARNAIIGATLAAVVLAGCMTTPNSVQPSVEGTHAMEIPETITVELSYTLEPTQTKTPTPTPTKTETPTPTETPKPVVIKTLPAEYIPNRARGEMGYNNFIFPEAFYSDFNMQLIDIVEGQVESIEIEGEYLIISISTRIRDKEVVLQSKVKGFNIENRLGDGDNRLPVFITAENIHDFEMPRIVRPLYLHMYEKIPPSDKTAIFNTCNLPPSVKSMQEYMKPMCANMALLENTISEKLTIESFAKWFEDKDTEYIDLNEVAILDTLFYYE